MIATLVNCSLIIIGTFIGLIFKRYIKQEITNSILKVLGVIVFIMGLIGILKSMILIDNNILTSRFDLFLIIVIIIGMFIGELLKIDYHLNNFGKFLERKFNFGKFSEAFITSTLIFVVGAMGIVGSVNAALGDPSIIYLKGALDGITAIILASTLGIGVLFSFLPVLIFQGTITLVAYYLGNFMSTEFIDAFSLIGYVIVLCIGINFLMKDKIKIANMLPSLLLVVIYYLIK